MGFALAAGKGRAGALVQAWAAAGTGSAAVGGGAPAGAVGGGLRRLGGRWVSPGSGDPAGNGAAGMATPARTPAAFPYVPPSPDRLDKLPHHSRLHRRSGGWPAPGRYAGPAQLRRPQTARPDPARVLRRTQSSAQQKMRHFRRPDELYPGQRCVDNDSCSARVRRSGS